MTSVPVEAVASPGGRGSRVDARPAIGRRRAVACGSIYMVGPLRARLIEAGAESRLGWYSRNASLVRVSLHRPHVRAGRAPCRARRRGAAIPGWSTEEFTVERIDADRVRLMREVEIEGEPGTPNAGQKFFADDLQMNIKTGELIAERQRGVPDADRANLRRQRGLQHQDQRRHLQQRHGIAQLGERGTRNLSMFGTLEPDVYFYGQKIEKIGQRQVPHHEGRLHDVRAADGAVADRQRQRDARPRSLRRC